MTRSISAFDDSTEPPATQSIAFRSADNINKQRQALFSAAPTRAASYHSDASEDMASVLEGFKRLLRLTEDAVVPDKDSKKLSRYELLSEINHGAFSKVYRARDKQTGNDVAIKKMSKARLKTKQKENILREAAIHKRLSHPNIVQFLDFFETEEHYYLILELMRGGELFQRIEEVDSFTEADARLVIAQVAKSIKYLHENNIVHRDIKPENLVFGNKTLTPVKLCDFGLSKIIDMHGSTDTPCGTVGYLAPEIAKEQAHAFGVDVWGLGCVLYALLCGFPVFYDQSIPVLTEKVKKGIYDFPSPWWDEISNSAKDLIRLCLTVDPAKRITIHQFLSHPWILGDAKPLMHALRSPAILREVDQKVVRMKDVFDVSLAAQRDATDSSMPHTNAIQKQPFTLSSITNSSLLGKRKKEVPA